MATNWADTKRGSGTAEFYANSNLICIYYRPRHRAHLPSTQTQGTFTIDPDTGHIYNIYTDTGHIYNIYTDTGHI